MRPFNRVPVSQSLWYNKNFSRLKNGERPALAVFRVHLEHRIYSVFSHATYKMFHSVTSGVNVYHRRGLHLLTYN